MASQQSTVDYILEQIKDAGTVSSKKMFGEYAIYCNGKVIALVCDDQLFVKPTIAGKSFATHCTEMPPYPGAKPYLLISGDMWENSEWLVELLQITELELPLPKKKSKKS